MLRLDSIRVGSPALKFTEAAAAGPLMFRPRTLADTAKMLNMTNWQGSNQEVFADEGGMSTRAKVAIAAAVIAASVGGYLLLKG